ncbi:MAG TPA: ribonuclease R [Bacilli bacterium]|nr:ribonuclease R [Bacilli bacterium]
MKEEVLSILKTLDKPVTVIELKDKLGIEKAEDLTSLLDVLKELEKDFTIYRTNKDKYMSFENSHLKKGKISVFEQGYGFLIQDGSDIHIDKDKLNGAVNGDLVVVEIIGKGKNKKEEGRVLKIAERDFGLLVGEFFTESDKYFLKLDDKKLKVTVELTKESSKDAVDGHKVTAKVVRKLSNDYFIADIVDIIGHKNDPGVDIVSVLYKFGINNIFSEEIEKELESVPNSVTEEEIKTRKDLREEFIYTIDGDDTKDIDDAISISKLDNGNYKLGVHIADVSYYVKPGTALYNEAYDRGTSVYLVDRVIPMLPHKLSNGICSLNPNEDRLTISCVMEIDNTGNIISHEIFESIIKSKIQMTYKKVNCILDGKEVPEGYEPYKDNLLLMNELAKILRKNKEKRGYIDFDVDEAKILVDETGFPTEIKLRDRGQGERLIEDFMIAANETVATHVFYMKLPFVYRVHDKPEEDRVKEFFAFLSSLGYTINADLKRITQATFQKILEDLKEKEEFPILSSLMLRTMQKAIYQIDNIGHFGIGSKTYTHFTSPIRRFPDTTVHRLLRTYLFNNDISEHTTSLLHDELIPLCEHSSEKERASIDCEREIDSMKMAEYMTKHIGEEFEGLISSITNFGFFVQLPNLIEGLVYISDIPGDYYNFDERRMQMVGSNKNIIYRMGQKIKVRVKAASKDDRTIDFEIVGDENDRDKQ